MADKYCIYCNHRLSHEQTEMASDHDDVEEDYEIDFFRCPHCGRMYEIASPTESEGYSTEPSVKKRTLTDEDIADLKTAYNYLGEEARLAINGEFVGTEDDIEYFGKGKEAFDKVIESLC